MPIATLIAAAAACGDDSGSGGGGGTAASSGATTASTTAGPGSTAVASASASAGGGEAPGSGGAGGGTGGAGGGTGGSACTPDPDYPILAEPPELLSETGLYVEGTLDVDPRVRGYTPEFPLWSDGLDKSRWVYLPDCGTIDTSDLDHWQFPVGTRFYKEFRVGDVRVETRVIVRVDDQDPLVEDWWFAAYHWTSEGDAVHVPEGVIDANGTHDIPPETQCKGCHGFLPERILGFGAIELAHDGAGIEEIDLDTLVDEGLLSDPPEIEIAIPAATPTERAALGYLHANCGHCHNETGQAFQEPFHMRLSVFDANREDTGVFQTAIGVPTELFVSVPEVDNRITAGDPASSCVNYRMGVRPGMPPYATEVVDDDAKTIMDAWVTELGAIDSQ